MAITIISKNSTVASKRPTAANLIAGELGLNLEATDPGLYYEDSAGNIRKVGGCSYSATAPNATPAGQTGNSVGELWYDTGAALLKAWDGAAWVGVGGGASAFDWQSAAGAPVVTVRSDASPLVDGDLYWDTTGNTLYGWDAAGSAWVPIGVSPFDWQSGAGDPTTTNPTTTRSDGGALVDGDQYWDTTNNQLYAYDLALTSWGAVGSGGLTVSLTAPTAPTEGDLWYNENDSRTYAAVNDLGGTAVWVDASPDGQRALITTSDNAPALPTEDDLWWNSTDGRMYVYYNDGTSTQWVETSPLRDPASIPPPFDPVPGDLVISADTNLSGPVLCKNLTIDAGVTVTVPNFELIITATETVTINGSIIADNSGANGVRAIGPFYNVGAGVVIDSGGFFGWNGPGSAQKTYSPTLYLGGSGAGVSYSVINSDSQAGGYVRTEGGYAGGAIAIRAYGDIVMGASAVLSANGQAGSIFTSATGDAVMVGTSGGSGGTIILHSSTSVTTAGTISATGGNGGGAGCSGGGCTSGLGGGHGGGGGTVIVQGGTVTNGATVSLAGGTGGAGINGAGLGLQLGATSAPANGGLGGVSNAIGGAVNGNAGSAGVLLSFGSPF